MKSIGRGLSIKTCSPGALKQITEAPGDFAKLTIHSSQELTPRWTCDLTLDHALTHLQELSAIATAVSFLFYFIIFKALKSKLFVG